MTAIAVVGAQWGDEGKGKVVDLLSEQADVVARFGGGANAGHTLVIAGEKLVTHLIPSGVLHPGTKCVLGDGMVVDPLVLVEEIGECKQRGLLAADELLVGDGAHVVMPYHRLVEGLRETAHAGTGGAIGTTRRGIGPTYESKAARRGVRIADLLDRARLAALVRANLDELGAVIAHYGGQQPDAAEVERWIDDAVRAGEVLGPSVGDAGVFVNGALDAGLKVLFEGAQGALLDCDHGTYPFVTASSTLAAGACQGLGIGPTRIDRVVGITKAYCTRVGNGPFPTEMAPEVAEVWRQKGAEFGATTGRPRRCGWLDLPALRKAVRLNGIEMLAMTKLDVMGVQRDLKLCVGYRVDGRVVDELPRDLDGAEPVYETLPGWGEEIRSAVDVSDLPVQAQQFVRTVEERIGVPFCLISVGPERNETAVLRDVFGR